MRYCDFGVAVPALVALGSAIAVTMIVHCMALSIALLRTACAFISYRDCALHRLSESACAFISRGLVCKQASLVATAEPATRRAEELLLLLYIAVAYACMCFHAFSLGTHSLFCRKSFCCDCTLHWLMPACAFIPTAFPLLSEELLL